MSAHPFLGKKAIMAVTNDLATDNRVRRHAEFLQRQGFDVITTGRIMPESLPLNNWPGKTRRVEHVFNRNVFFYAEYNIRLFFYLLFQKTDLIISNDLDTLPACRLAAMLKRKPLVYDSHELFTEVPELETNPFAKNTWKLLEKLSVPGIRYAITVNDSIAKILGKRYGVPFRVVRNVPERYTPAERKTRAELGLPENKKIIILQVSGINVRRGAEEAVMAMKQLDIPAVLLIAGSGDVIPELKKITVEEKLQDKILFKNKMPYSELMAHTAVCDLGLTLDKGDNLNYLYSLPNKLFDYIQAGIPVLASDLPEIRNIVDKYRVGEITESTEPVYLAQKIKFCLTDMEKRMTWQKNTTFAAEICCRSNEEHILSDLYEQVFPK
jgi:glycosyltransferase involved in cell wall biosynthesis